MKVYNATTGNSLILAFLKVVRFDEQDQQMTGSPDEADVIMTNSLDELRRFYSSYGEKKFFVVLDTTKREINMTEDNVFGAGLKQLVTNVMEISSEAITKYQTWAANREEKPKEVSKPSIGNIIPMSKSYKVLIVDDRRENLQIAVERLVAQQIILVDSPAEALKYLKLEDGHEKPSIDAVLTDLNMKPDKMYPSLNLDHYGLNDEVPAGISIMFEATKRGLPVAIVTDANHHQDWFSAMFDHVKGATVNGQKVIFCQENGGKRWDAVLKKLMEE